MTVSFLGLRYFLRSSAVPDFYHVRRSQLKAIAYHMTRKVSHAQVGKNIYQIVG